MNRRIMAYAVAAFLTVSAAACDTPAGLNAPGSPHYDGQQAPPNPTDSASIPAGTQADTTAGRGGGGFLGSGT
jgi:hypothetical protein